MKILLLHTEYQHKGGEDSVVIQEQELLKSAHEVKTILYKNDGGMRGALQFFSSLYNVTSAMKVRNEIRLFKPDIVHFHNWHFALGPAAIRAAKKEKVPIVVTLHNFRLLCPSATLLCNGNIFIDSLKSSFPWKAVIRKVYRKSFLQTFWLAFVIWFHKKLGTWEMVNRYIVLTNFAKDIFIDSSLGLNSEYFSVKPNFVELPPFQRLVREDHFLFVGRLSLEKGIFALIDAFRETQYTLYIAGDGPLKNEVRNIVSHIPNVKLLGNLSKEEVLKEMSRCTALVFPSIWFEGMPMTIIEAFALGTPVIASNLGAMSSMIEHKYNGLHFEADNALDLREQIYYWDKLDFLEKQKYQKNALSSFVGNYTSKLNLGYLMNVYLSVVHKKY